MRRIIASCLRALSETPIVATVPITGSATMFAALAGLDVAPPRGA